MEDYEKWKRNFDNFPETLYGFIIAELSISDPQISIYSRHTKEDGDTIKEHTISFVLPIDYFYSNMNSSDEIDKYVTTVSDYMLKSENTVAKDLCFGVKDIHVEIMYENREIHVSIEFKCLL